MDSREELHKIEKPRQFTQIFAILSGCLAAFTAGLLFGWTSPTIPILISEDSPIPISLEEASYLPVIPAISLGLASPIFAILIDATGRKIPILLLSVPYFVSALLTAFATTLIELYVARALAGFSDAALFVTLPTYIGEVSEPKVRGTWGNAMSSLLYFGVFTVNIVGAFNTFRNTALFIACVPVVHVILFSFVPESPYYLLMRNRKEDARKSLRTLRWMDNVDHELDRLELDVKRQISERGRFREIFTIPANRKAVLICMGIRAAQQFSGLAAFELYTVYMFKQSGGNISEGTSAIIFSGLLFVCCTLSAFIVEKCGRRPLMIYSCLGCGIILTLETVYFFLKDCQNVNVAKYNWMPLSGMLMYILANSSGIGIIPNLILSELFSASIKGKAMIVTNISFAICGVTVPKIFQVLTSSYGLTAPFGFFAICCMLSVLFSYFYVPETKGKTLEEIQQELRGT